MKLGKKKMIDGIDGLCDGWGCSVWKVGICGGGCIGGGWLYRVLGGVWIGEDKRGEVLG